VQIKGVRWYDVPYVGRFNSLVTGSQRQVVLVAVVGFLLGYATYMFASDIRERRTRRIGSQAVAA
jgi:signal peptidase